MKTPLAEVRTALVLTLVFAPLLCGVYPLAVWAAGEALFSRQANGSLVTDRDGAVRGSTLLGQNFASAKYFQPRPSAAGSGYDAANSSGTNLGPTSRKLADAIKAAVVAYRSANDLADGVPVPADAVTSSASGLDPHISLANAEIQARRVARVRGWPLPRVEAMVLAQTDGRTWGVLGEPGVNVLELNLALDEAGGTR